MYCFTGKKQNRIKPNLQHFRAHWQKWKTNTSTVTINTSSPYTRSAIDTILGSNGGLRTLDYTITINFINVKRPRETGLD